jgi:hypothetical protein
MDAQPTGNPTQFPLISIQRLSEFPTKASLDFQAPTTPRHHKRVRLAKILALGIHSTRASGVQNWTPDNRPSRGRQRRLSGWPKRLEREARIRSASPVQDEIDYVKSIQIDNVGSVSGNERSGEKLELGQKVGPSVVLPMERRASEKLKVQALQMLPRLHGRRRFGWSVYAKNVIHSAGSETDVEVAYARTDGEVTDRRISVLHVDQTLRVHASRGQSPFYQNRCLVSARDADRAQ